MNTTTRTEKTRSQVPQEILVMTTGVDLVKPEPGLTTQRDANVNFESRITALEPLLTEINGGTY